MIKSTIISPRGEDVPTGLDWIDLRLADGAAPVDPEGMLRVPITDTDGLWDVDFLNDTGGTVAFRTPAEAVRVDFGVLADLLPTGAGVEVAVQFYDMEFVSRVSMTPQVTLCLTATPPDPGTFEALGPGFRLSSDSSSVVTGARAWPAVQNGTSLGLSTSVPSEANTLAVQGRIAATLPTGQGGAWAANDTDVTSGSRGTSVTRTRLMLLLNSASSVGDGWAARMRFRCRYAVVPTEDFPA